MNIEKMTSEFYNKFNSNHVILYVGQNAKDDEIKDIISTCRWSAVVTSRRDPEFSALFVNDDRSPKEFFSRRDVSAKPLSREKTPVLRLFGVSGTEDDDEDLSWLSTESHTEYDMEEAGRMLELLPEILDYVNPLVIIGIDSDIDCQLINKYLAKLLYSRTSDGSVSFWGMSPDKLQMDEGTFNRLKRVAEEKSFGFYETELAEVVKSRLDEMSQIEEDEILYSPENDSDIYFQAQKPISVSRAELMVFNNVGTLLTERTLNKVRPLGRIQSQQWFSNFIELSSMFGPQWYGYLPQSTFYVKRSYEDALVQLVRLMLAGKGVTGNSASPCPIVLTGDPGSSKSITLGALAYRIYNEKTNPVLFISDDDIVGGDFTNRIEGALQAIVDKSVTDTRILIVWDSSTYLSGVERMGRFLTELENKGRRVVLVCSGYRIIGQEGNGYRLAENGNKFESCDSKEAQVVSADGYYYVKATREMNEHEKYEFWRIAKEYSGISAKTISDMRNKLNGQNSPDNITGDDIFQYYYKLISLLRDNLEKGLKKEQSKVFQYVQKELDSTLEGIKNDAKEEIKTSPMYLAMMKAGIAVDELGIEEEHNDNNIEELEEKLDTLNLCVALFSRFKLTVPYSLAYTILLGDDVVDRYSNRYQELFKLVTTELPWLYYGETGTGDYAFSFRNSLEADIYLQRHDMSGTQQINLLCKIIDIYGQDYRRSKCKDLNFTNSLQALLRLMGPNSQYFSLRKDSLDYINIQAQLEVLINKIIYLLEDYGVPDEDAGFTTILITFTREYYGAFWNSHYMPVKNDANEEINKYEHEHFKPEDYELRLKKMVNAISLAEQGVEALETRCTTEAQSLSAKEKSRLLAQRDSLVVETAQCNMRLEEYGEEYRECCECLGVDADTRLLMRRLHYPTIYKQLLSVIYRDQTNGYAYNALFKAFERMYEKERGLPEEEKIQNLSEIMQLVEICENLGASIVNRGGNGKDELSPHLAKIRDIAANFQITLDSVYGHIDGKPAKTEEEEAFFRLYDNMLESNNASAITFICQKELKIPSGTQKLEKQQLDSCERVYQFLKTNKKNYECVSSNSYALAMLIRVAWMRYNKTTLSGNTECQLTRLTIEQWYEIYDYCRTYVRIEKENRQPIIILLYALAAIQVGRMSEESYIEAVEILAMLDEAKFYHARMRTPFMICPPITEEITEPTPKLYTGTVLTVKGNNGYIRIHDLPLRLRNDVGVRFRHYNLGRDIPMPEVNQLLNNLELGIGYTSLSVYTKAGRKFREGSI